MRQIKNQQMYHATKNGQRTICGLSNQWNDALTLEQFHLKLQDASWTKYCCAKCEIKK